MSRKPTSKTSKGKPQKQARKPLPLSHPTNWLPVAKVHKLLSQHCGDIHLATFDLNEALERNQVRCMRRSTASGDREPVPLTFWADFELSFWSDGLLVVQRPVRRGYHIVRSVRGWVFNVWKPDVVKIWPPLLEGDATPLRFLPKDAARQ
jgi:hypothetical protein